jgi:phosphatidylethanolamine-binding protein (PEBP) family uncharacterized protein
MQKPQAALSSAIIMVALVLAGCASSGSDAPARTEVAFKSPAITAHTLPASYTCDGKNMSPPLEWGAVPADTGELLLLAVGLTPTPGTKNYTATIVWAMSGVSPALHRLNAGQIPSGAHIGLASNGKRRYAVCPRMGETVQYQFMLYGVPASAKISPDFADQPIVNALSQSGTATSATSEGAFVATYRRD